MASVFDTPGVTAPAPAPITKGGKDAPNQLNVDGTNPVGGPPAAQPPASAVAAPPPAVSANTPFTTPGTAAPSTTTTAPTTTAAPPPPATAGTMAPAPAQSLYGYSAAAAPKAPDYTAATSGTSGQPAQVAWDESMSTAGRLDSMLNSSSPLMKSAELAGKQRAAKYGLMSSSLAVGAAQKAMIDSAAPIAANDANLFSNQAIQNMAQANNWNIADLNRALTDKQFAATLGLDYDKLQEQARQFEAGLGLESDKLKESSRIEDAKLGESARVADMNYNIADRRLTQEDKQFLATYGLKVKEIDNQMEQFAKQFGLSVQDLAMRKDQLNQQDRQYYDGLSLERDKLEQQARQFNTDWENRFSLQGMADKARVDLATLDGKIKENLIGIEASYKKDIANSENVSNAWGTMMQMIGNIQNNPDLDAETKKTLIQNNINGFQSFANFWKKASGGTIDVADLLNFGITSAGSGGGKDNTGVNPVTDASGHNPDSTPGGP